MKLSFLMYQLIIVPFLFSNVYTEANIEEVPSAPKTTAELHGTNSDIMADVDDNNLQTTKSSNEVPGHTVKRSGTTVIIPEATIEIPETYGEQLGDEVKIPGKRTEIAATNIETPMVTHSTDPVQCEDAESTTQLKSFRIKWDFLDQENKWIFWEIVSVSIMIAGVSFTVYVTNRIMHDDWNVYGITLDRVEEFRAPNN